MSVGEEKDDHDFWTDKRCAKPRRVEWTKGEMEVRSLCMESNVQCERKNKKANDFVHGEVCKEYQ